MTPDLMEAGAERYARAAEARRSGRTESGGRSAAFSRPLRRASAARA